MSQAEYFATPDLDFSFPTRLGIVQQVAVSPAAVAKGKGVHSAMNPSFGDIYDRYQKLTLTTHLPAVIACSETLSLGKDQGGNDSNLLIVFYVQIMPDDFVMQLHRF
ncbi:Crp/Fnr family transcriptional regulator [Klebsiella pneumoniae]|nr:Crp/Fnr family transcriptional regulator [Klebsiella pneumoniae]VAU24290.1 Crp/Fnr family transcriptional regulator [Klebsiella pneumoniae]